MRLHIRLAIPLGAYLFITVFLPLLSGAGARPTFPQHARAILLTSAVVTAASIAVHVALRRLRRKSQP